MPDIFVGGNGSRILNWLTGGTFSNANPFLDVLKDTILDSSHLATDSRFNIQFSERPKVEVACGMIETRPTNDGEFFDEAIVMAKEQGFHRRILRTPLWLPLIIIAPTL